MPASTLDRDSYYCKNLNYVKCQATGISATFCTGSWLVGVSPTGTFIKADEMDAWTTDYTGIPEGWTVNNASEMTGISATPLNDGQSTMRNIYDLQGRRVEQPEKGIYLMNGKKILLR